VLGKLVRGDIKLYRFTVAEGPPCRRDGAGHRRHRAVPGSGVPQDRRDPSSPKKYGVPGPSLEGYLFPDTYSLPRGAGCGGVVHAMVSRFQKAWQQADAERLPSVTLDDLQAVTLASIVEKETGRPEERPRISCVFHNRLKKKMRLQTDPTVVYALLLSNDFKWDHNIHKDDLLLQPRRYNTYFIKGLPPGPIANPGLAALEAALHPVACRRSLLRLAQRPHATYSVQI